MPNFLGRGLAFPVQLNDRDRFSMVEGDADIRQAIYIIINTIPGERVLRPNFGCEIHSLIFSPANSETASLAERYVREALALWEPRIDLIDITVTPGATERGEMLEGAVHGFGRRAGCFERLAPGRGEDHHPGPAATRRPQQFAVEVDHRLEERAGADQRYRSGHTVSLPR